MTENIDVTWHPQSVTRPRGCVVWFTGLSGSGKSTIANLVDQKLHDLGLRSYVLDGDNIRHGLCASPDMLAPVHGDEFANRFGLGFSAEDREENIRRIGAVAELFCSAGLVTLTAFVSPYRRDRNAVRRAIEAGDHTGDFIEVHVDAPLAVCESRDPKGLYKKARSGELSGMTGIDAPYEPPENPEITLKTSQQPAENLAEQVVSYLRTSGKI